MKARGHPENAEYEDIDYDYEIEQERMQLKLINRKGKGTT